MNPYSEQAYEYYEEHKEELFGNYIQADKVSDESLIDIMFTSDLIFTMVMEAWIKAHPDELLDWYLASLPDGSEEQ